MNKMTPERFTTGWKRDMVEDTAAEVSEYDRAACRDHGLDPEELRRWCRDQLETISDDADEIDRAMKGTER